MKLTSLLASAAIATTGLSVPTMTVASIDLSFAPLNVQVDSGHGIIEDDGSFETAKRGRGRGRGGDRDRGGDDDRGGRDRNDDGPSSRDRNDDGPSGRDRPRIPGGSGCDDPGDVIEHAECRV